MLDLFVQLSRRHQVQLSVAHIDHQLRSASADDARFVEELAAAHHLAYFSEKISTKAYAVERRLSIEAAARELRYAALERLRIAAGAALIATAHTRSDQAETVLLRLFRGAGLAGLAGIAERRGNIIRPLLGFSRQSILAYARERGLSWREDESNQDLTIPRNRLRHEILPLLANRFNPNVEAALARTARIAREAHADMRRRAETALSRVIQEQTPARIVLDIQRINKYNRFIHSYILRQACLRLTGEGGMPSHRRLARALKMMSAGRVGTRVRLARNVEVVVDRDGIVLQKSERAVLHDEVKAGVPVTIPGTPWRLLVADENWEGNRDVPHADQYSEYVDADTIKSPLWVRWPRRGDSFYPLGMQHQKKINDFFADGKVPLRRRTATPVLECESGIVWVCGFRIDDRFKVTDKTKRVFHLQLIQID